MTELDDRLAQHAKLAIRTAADELGIDALDFAQRLNGAEIARLVHLLNAALPDVENSRLRHRIEDLLLSVTDGRMPSEDPESELDWALKVSKRRRAEELRRDPSPEGLEGLGEDEKGETEDDRST